MSSIFYGSVDDLTERVRLASNNEEIYICPYCPEQYGSPDKSGHMYLNTRKGWGYCHRCGARAAPSDDHEPDYSRSKLPSERAAEERFREQAYGDEIMKSVPIRYDEYVLRYALSRGASYKDMDKYQVRAARNPTRIVFINGLVSGATDFYQVRYLQGDLKHRFPKGAVKPLCWLSRCKSNVMLVEGFFDALSVLRVHREFKPAVLLGKSLTQFQLQQLHEHARRFKNFNIRICMDGGTASEALQIKQQIESKFSAEVDIIHLPGELDPNQLLVKGRLAECLL